MKKYFKFDIYIYIIYKTKYIIWPMPHLYGVRGELKIIKSSYVKM